MTADGLGVLSECSLIATECLGVLSDYSLSATDCSLIATECLGVLSDYSRNPPFRRHHVREARVQAMLGVPPLLPVLLLHRRVATRRGAKVTSHSHPSPVTPTSPRRYPQVRRPLAPVMTIDCL